MYHSSTLAPSTTGENCCSVSRISRLFFQHSLNGTGTQTRSFVYSGNYLISATNPENGTGTYGYNANNQLISRTDAKNQPMEVRNAFSGFRDGAGLS